MANVALDNISATYSGAQFNELFLEPIFRDSDIMQFRVIPNVKHKMNLYTADALSCIVKKYTTCGGNESGDFNINDKVITAGRMRVAVSQCQDAFFGTFLEESFKNGVNVFNLEGTALMDTILENVRNGISQDVTRLAWWGDVDESGSNASCYDSTDGWWKLLIANSVVNANKVAIANSGAFTTGDAIVALRAMWASAPSALQGVPNNEKGIYVSRLMYDDYLTSLENLGNAEGFSQLVDGSIKVYFRGVEVIPMYDWDVATAQRLITDNVRACYVAKQNLAVGTDTNDPEGEMKMFYDDLTEKVYVRAYFKLGVQFLHDSLVQIGY
tara:strand:+ start:14975 stop:15955 length:981 start_codon:yes stop_codon:yes gene_type:complete